MSYSTTRKEEEKKKVKVKLKEEEKDKQVKLLFWGWTEIFNHSKMNLFKHINE